MKKLLLTLLSVLMVFTLATTNAFAEDEADTKDTELTYEVEEEESTYEWTVPASTAISTEEKEITGLEVTSASLKDDEKVQITVASTNGWKVKSGNNEIAYTLALTSGGDALANNDVVLETTEAKAQSLYATLSEAGTVAGKYSDTLTFTASIVETGPVAGIYANGTCYKELTLADCGTDASKVKTLITKANSTVILPSGVTSIAEDAFRKCSNLTSVTFEDESQLTTIGSNAFYSSAITSITIPKSVTSIGESAFDSCGSLATVTFEGGSNLNTIGKYAFYNCTSISSITIPASVTSIDTYAFQNCGSLVSITFEEGSKLATIGEKAFYQSGLTSITISKSVTSIGESAFDSCGSLVTVTFEGGSNLNTISSYAFYNCTSISSLTIPDGVASIGNLAFYGIGHIYYSGSATGSPWGAKAYN